jgi:uncharacterized membrane protein (DUF106 family)
VTAAGGPMIWVMIVGIIVFCYVGTALIHVIDKLRMRFDEMQIALFRIRDELAEMNKANKNAS